MWLTVYCKDLLLSISAASAVLAEAVIILFVVMNCYPNCVFHTVLPEIIMG